MCGLDCRAANHDKRLALLCRFILKTDDDAFVNVPAFVQQLRLLCESPDCRKEHLYMGKQCRRGKVILSEGHKWDNGAYYNHTGERPHDPMAFAEQRGKGAMAYCRDCNKCMQPRTSKVESLMLCIELRQQGGRCNSAVMSSTCRAGNVCKLHVWRRLHCER